LRYIEDKDLRSHVLDYSKVLDTGKRVLVISHSQGTFYANAARNLLSARRNTSDGPLEEKFQILAVATPTDLVEGNGLHVTNTDDVVVNLVRLLKGALPGNVSNSNNNLENHSFVESYLDGRESRAKVFRAFTELARRFEVKNDWGRFPTLNHEGYLASDLLPMRRWALRHRANYQEHLEDYQCLAVAALAYQYDRTALRCGERNLASSLKWLEECATGEWANEDRAIYYDCPIWNVNSPESIAGWQLILEVLSGNEQCRWTANQLPQKIGANLEAAKEFLKYPTARSTAPH
jgi:hypothetical protein